MKVNFLGMKPYVSQAFATFEYQKIKFDFVCELDSEKSAHSDWQIVDDEMVQKMRKTMNVERLIDSCCPVLNELKHCLFERL